MKSANRRSPAQEIDLFISRPVILYFSFLLIFGLVYSPVLFFDYLFHDDVFFWFKPESGFEHPLHDLLMAMGRYTSAWLATFESRFVHDVTDLKYLRLWGLFGLSACAFTVFRQMRRLSIREIHAFLATVALFLLPGFQDIIFYAVGSFFIWSVFLACLAFEIIIEGGSIFWGIVLFLTSLTIYPPGTMFYWPMTALVLLFSQDKPRASAPYFFFRPMAAGLAGLLVYAFLIYGMGPFFTHITPLPLYNLYGTPAHDLSGKFRWFLTEPLVNALNLWDIFPKRSTTIIVPAFVILTLFLAAWKSSRQAIGQGKWDILWPLFRKAGLFICLFFLAFLPNLAARENAAFYRCLVALTSLIGFLLLWSCLWWMRKFPPAAGRWILTFILSSTVMYAGFKSFHNILVFRVYPSHLEWTAFKSMASNIPFHAGDTVYIICPNHLPAIERYDEFGVWTSQYSEDIYPLLYCAFHKPAGDPSLPFVKITFPDDFKIYDFKQFLYTTRPDGQRVIQEIGSPRRPLALSLNSNIRIGSRNDRGVVNIAMPDDNPAMKPGTFILNLRELIGEKDFSQVPGVREEMIMNRGAALAHQGRFVEALTEYNEVIKTNPAYAKAYYNRGVIFSFQGRLNQAVSDYKKALGLDPQLAQAYFNLGSAYYHLGDFALAVVNYTRAIGLSPAQPETYANRAMAYYQLKKYDQAWRDVRQAYAAGAWVNPLFLSALKAAGK